MEMRQPTNSDAISIMPEVAINPFEIVYDGPVANHHTLGCCSRTGRVLEICQISRMFVDVSWVIAGLAHHGLDCQHSNHRKLRIKGLANGGQERRISDDKVRLCVMKYRL